MTNVITAVSKFVISLSEGMNHRQFKGFLGDMESRYGDWCLLYTSWMIQSWTDA